MQENKKIQKICGGKRRHHLMVTYLGYSVLAGNPPGVPDFGHCSTIFLEYCCAVPARNQTKTNESANKKNTRPEKRNERCSVRESGDAETKVSEHRRRDTRRNFVEKSVEERNFIEMRARKKHIPN